MAGTDFDPYHKWLGIPPREQPPNHYRLLGVALFEADSDVIDAAADRQMAYVAQCAMGPHIDASQKLLNELSVARLCLLTPAKRARYDDELKQRLEASAPSAESPPAIDEQQAQVFDAFAKITEQESTELIRAPQRKLQKARRGPVELITAPAVENRSGNAAGWSSSRRRLLFVTGGVATLLILAVGFWGVFGLFLKSSDEPEPDKRVAGVGPPLVADSSGSSTPDPGPAPRSAPAQGDPKPQLAKQELVLKPAPQSENPPSTTGPLVIAVFRHSPRLPGDPSEIAFLWGGTIQGERATWRIDGQRLILDWTDRNGTRFHDDTELAIDGRSYSGRNQMGIQIRGEAVRVTKEWLARIDAPQNSVAGGAPGAVADGATAATRILQVKTTVYYPSGPDYARHDGNAFEVGIGNKADGVGIGGVGYELSGVQSVDVEGKIEGELRRYDDNSFLGFIVDYKTPAGYSHRVAVATGMCFPGRWNTAPPWGKATKPDRIVVLGKAGLNKRLELAEWAPAEWTGDTWLTPLINNGGTGTSFTGRLTEFHPITGGRPVPTIGDLRPGVVAELFNDVTFTNRVKTRVDLSIDFDWGTNAPDPSCGKDHFGIRWTGFLVVPEPGEYELILESDNGSRLTVDGKPVIDKLSENGRHNLTARVQLSGKPQPIVLEFLEGILTAWCKLKWVRPGETVAVAVPQAALFHAAAQAQTAPAPGGAMAAVSTPPGSSPPASVPPAPASSTAEEIAVFRHIVSGRATPELVFLSDGTIQNQNAKWALTGRKLVLEWSNAGQDPRRDELQLTTNGRAYSGKDQSGVKIRGEAVRISNDWKSRAVAKAPASPGKTARVSNQGPTPSGDGNYPNPILVQRRALFVRDRVVITFAIRNWWAYPEEEFRERPWGSQGIRGPWGGGGGTCMSITQLRNLGRGLTADQVVQPAEARVKFMSGRELVSNPIIPHIPQGTPTLDFNAERRVAESLLQMGVLNKVVLDKSGQHIFPKDSIPDEDFSVLEVNFRKLPTAEDADVAKLAPLRILQSIDISETKLTGVELRHLKGLESLEALHCVRTPITDAGMREIGKFRGLFVLGFEGGEFTDAGFAALHDLEYLGTLTVIDSPLTDKSFATIGTLHGLQSLTLRKSRPGERMNLTSAGMAPLRKLVSLRHLDLEGLQVTDEGLSALTTMRVLERLQLGETQVTDDGLRALEKLTNLKNLRISSPQITSAGATRLRDALPKCQISGLP